MRAILLASALVFLSCSIVASLQVKPLVTEESYFGINGYNDTIPSPAKLGRELESDSFLSGGAKGMWTAGAFGAALYYSAESDTLGVAKAYLSLYEKNLLLSVGKQIQSWGNGQTFQPTYFLSFLSPIDGAFSPTQNTADVWSVQAQLRAGETGATLLAAIDSAAIEKLEAPGWYAGMWRQTFYPTDAQLTYDIAFLSRSGLPVVYSGVDLQWTLSDTLTFIASGDLGLDVSNPGNIFDTNLTQTVQSKSFLIGMNYASAPGLFTSVEGGYDGFWAGGLIAGYAPAGSKFSTQLVGRVDIQSGAVLGSVELSLQSSPQVTNILRLVAYHGPGTSPISISPMTYQVRYYIEYKL